MPALGDTGLHKYLKIVPRFCYLDNRLTVNAREQHFRNVEKVYTAEESGFLESLVNWWVWFYLISSLPQKIGFKKSVWVVRNIVSF